MGGDICIGLMSGTSVDAVDAAACEFDADGKFQRLLGTHTLAYPPELRLELLKLQRWPDTPVTLRDLARLDAAIGDRFARAARGLLDKLGLAATDVLAVGSHGQTLFHDPTLLVSSLQLGDPNRIAAATGVRTVSDFRRADMAHGGQGAPLVPAFHHALFGAARHSRVVLNIGGIANLTLLPGAAGSAVSGFDTGPGNALLDDWAQKSHGAPFDHDGAWAAAGQPDSALLAACLDDAYFAAAAPKSTGRDYFNLDWLARRFPAFEECAAADVQRSLLELSIETIGRAVDAQAPDCAELFVCGGGARNRFLMERLVARLPAVRVRDTADAGLDPGWVEACAFAWLAWRSIHGRSGNLPAVTGARRPAVLGGLYGG